MRQPAERDRPRWAAAAIPALPPTASACHLLTAEAFLPSPTGAPIPTGGGVFQLINTYQVRSHGLQLQSLWIIPMDNPYCSCNPAGHCQNQANLISFAYTAAPPGQKPGAAKPLARALSF